MVYVSKDILPLFKELVSNAKGNLMINEMNDPRSNDKILSFQENLGGKGDEWAGKQIISVLNDAGEIEFKIIDKNAPKKEIPDTAIANSDDLFTFDATGNTFEG